MLYILTLALVKNDVATNYDNDTIVDLFNKTDKQHC